MRSSAPFVGVLLFLTAAVRPVCGFKWLGPRSSASTYSIAYGVGRVATAKVEAQRPMVKLSSLSTPSQQEHTALQADDDLKSGIAAFYDESTAIWEEVWGDHLHHGYYYTGREKDHRQAQVDMIEESLNFASVSRVKKAVDVGCGIGGSSRHLAQKFGAKVKGITLSPFQRSRAEALTKKAGLGDKAEFEVADALQMPFAADSFDLVWSLESGEHMPDKRQFVKELVRVAAPGGKIIIITWCHRELKPGESLTAFERGLLKLINSIYFLPPWVPISRYCKLANEYGLQNVRWADWTDRIKPFWPAVLRSSLKPKSLKVIFTSRTVRRGALAILYMMLGYACGLIKFGVVTGDKASA